MYPRVLESIRQLLYLEGHISQHQFHNISNGNDTKYSLIHNEYFYYSRTLEKHSLSIYFCYLSHYC